MTKRVISKSGDLLMDFRELAETLGLEKDEYIELLELLISTSKADLGILQTAVDNENLEEVAKKAHSLKGASVSLGLTDISDLARQIEKNAKNGSLEGLSEKIMIIREKLVDISSSLD